VLRWARVPVDCGGCESADAVQARIRDALTAARAEAAADRGLVARIVLEGETMLSDALANRREALRDEARALAAAIAPDLWLEKVSIHTRPPVAAETVELSGDLVAMLAGAGDDPDLADALAAEFAPFLSAVAPALPPEADELRHAAGAGDWRQVAHAAAAALRARLGAAG